MKLIPAEDAEPSDLPSIVKPFFAVSEVEQRLSNPALGSPVNHNHGPVRLSDGHSGRARYTEGDVLKDVREGRIVLVDKLGGFPAFPMFEYKDGQWRSTEDFRTDFFLQSSLDYLIKQKLTPDDIKMGAAQGGATFAGTTSTALNDDVAADTTNATPDRKLSLPLGESAKVAPLAAVPAAQTAANNEPDKIEPGFHVVRQPMSLDELKHELYGSNSAVPNRFNELNPNLKGVVLPGQMIVLGDPNGSECTLEEAQLMDVADQVNREVNELSEEEAQLLADNYDLFQFVASSGSAGVGAGSLMISRQLNSINNALKKLEKLHQSTYQRIGHLNNESFFKQRRAIFKELDFSLGSVARKGLSLDSSTKLKNALGLSSKSIVHHWNTSGVGQIPGYSTHFDKVASAAKWARAGGLLALTLDASVSVSAIEEACTLESDGVCTETQFAEVGRFGGGALGGSGGAAVGTGICVAVGIGTGGPGGIACLVLLGGAGSAAGGAFGSSIFKSAGEELYQYIYSE